MLKQEGKRIFQNHGLACEKRNKRKDAYDLIYVLTNYEGGVPALASEITQEEKMENSFKNAMA